MMILILFIKLGLGHMLIRIKPIWHTWLVKVMQYRVSDIRVKRGGMKNGLQLKLKICGYNPFQTNNDKNRQKNKQTNK